MDGTAKELRHIHDYIVDGQTEGAIEHLHERWRQLQTDCQERLHNLQGLMGDMDPQNGSPLQGKKRFLKYSRIQFF